MAIVCYCRLAELLLAMKTVKYMSVPRHYGNSNDIWDHTVLSATRQRWHSRLYPTQ